MNQNSLAYEVSNLDILKKLHHSAKIIEYSQLSNCSDILQYIPDTISILVILLQTGKGGHWTCLCRRDNIITYMDSYGVAPDGELKNISTNTKMKLHENKPYLSSLLKLSEKQGFKIIYNKLKLQEYSPKINTCGKHCVVFINAMLDGFTLAEYLKLLKQKKKQTGLSYDEIINEIYNNN